MISVQDVVTFYSKPSTAINMVLILCESFLAKNVHLFFTIPFNPKYLSTLHGYYKHGLASYSWFFKVNYFWISGSYFSRYFVDCNKISCSCLYLLFCDWLSLWILLHYADWLLGSRIQIQLSEEPTNFLSSWMSCTCVLFADEISQKVSTFWDWR